MGFALLVPATRASAQAGLGVGVDPFSLYYGYYLPHQAYVAAQPRPMDTLNAISAERQSNAVTDRAGLYDPVSPYAQDDNDPLRPYGTSGRGARGERMGQIRSFATSTNSAGQGPRQFYGRTDRFFPQVRGGQGPNRNLAVHRAARGGGGMGGGMPSMPGVR